MITKNYLDIFVGQYLELTLRAGIDVSGGNLTAKTKKPAGTEANHAVSVTSASAGLVLLTFATDYLTAGKWEIKLYDLTTKVTGKTFTLYVNTVWEN